MIDQIMKTMPPIITAMAGDAKILQTPSGWLHMKYFVTVPVIFGAFAVMAGAGMLATDEERGRLDLLMAHPTDRWKVFYGRLAALFTATAIILFINWLGLIAALPFSSLGVTPAAAALPFISLFGLVILFQSFALLLSFFLGSRILAAGAAGVVLIADFFIDALIIINPSIEQVAKWLPYHYYQGGLAADGFAFGPFAVLIAATAIMIGLACWRFQNHDIRVMGEGSINWPWKTRKSS
ncbi:MAG: ABC-2 type transport system permease protein [Verrucomicrobiales bacterium]|jgi:ABC-2 type transport system permease protein